MSRSDVADITDLAALLATIRPFSALSPEQREFVAAGAEVREYAPGALVVDGFREPATDVFVVLEGRLGLWQQAESSGLPDGTQERGGFFGFAGMLTGRRVGPRVHALTECVIARIPATLATPAFTTRAGTRFLADHLLDFAEKAQYLPGYATTGGLIDQEPVVVDADTPLRRVADELTQQRRPGVVVRQPDGSLGLITDGSLRRRVLAEGLSPDATAGEACARGVPIVQAGDSTGEVLTEILGAQTEAAIVTDQFGTLQGVVGLREFALSPTTADVGLHEQLRLAASRDELIQRARRTPDVLAGLLAQGLAGVQAIRVFSGLVDVVVRRALELRLADYPDLSLEGFTWLTLGSHGRREAVLSSDLESAVVFPDATPAAVMARYRQLFADVETLLSEAGFTGDENGVSARRAIMSRTASQWRRAVGGWLADPYENQGAMMISLLVDGRPVFGDANLARISLELANLRRHPATMRALLDLSLTERAASKPRELPWRRSATFDVKQGAIRPLVNLARWIGLAQRAQLPSTPERLRCAVGTDLLTPDQANALAEGFGVLERLRLRSQLAQLRQGHTPSNKLRLASMSAIDRASLAEVVHEITVAQRRLANIGVGEADWKRGGAAR